MADTGKNTSRRSGINLSHLREVIRIYNQRTYLPTGIFFVWYFYLSHLSVLSPTSVPFQAPSSSTIAPYWNTDSPSGIKKNDGVHRRCLGQFLNRYESDANISGYNRTKINESSLNQATSILGLLHNHTSCDIESEQRGVSTSSVPSWRQKKKISLEGKTNNAATEAERSTATDGTTPYHVMILLTQATPMYEDVITLASGLLVAGLDVTIFYIGQDDTNPVIADMIESAVFSRMPPINNDDHGFRANDSFSIVLTNLTAYRDYASDACKGISPAHVLDPCAIDTAPAIVRLLMYEVGDYLIASKWNRTFVLREENERNLDFVMMMDASNLGGFIFCELNMIPVIALGTHLNLASAMEYDPDWSLSPARSTLDRMDRFFEQRIRSIFSTTFFLRANRMRYSLGLKRLKSPVDFFQPLSMVTMLALTFPMDSSFLLSTSVPEKLEINNISDSNTVDLEHADPVGSTAYDGFIHSVHPLLPPCTPCLNEPTIWDEESRVAVILVAPPTGLSARWTRSLIRALSLTKQSLEGYDECLFDHEHCRNDVAGFEVEWLVKEGNETQHFLPPVLPPFIHKKLSVNLVDSVVRNPNTIIALVECTSEASVLSAFGIEVFCINQSGTLQISDSFSDLMEKRHGTYHENRDRNPDIPNPWLDQIVTDDNLEAGEVATKLLRALRRKAVGTDHSFPKHVKSWSHSEHSDVARLITSGLDRTVQLVEVAAKTQREEKQWKSVIEMRQVVSHAITESIASTDRLQRGANMYGAFYHKDIFRRQAAPTSGLSIFVAWVIFILVFLYAMLKDSTIIKRWRHHHHHRHGWMGEILVRLSDLDDSWDMFLSWLSTLDVVVRKPSSDLKESTLVEMIDQPSLNHNRNGPQHIPGSHVRRRRKTKATR